MYCAYASSLQEFEKVLKQKQVKLELLEVKLAQKSVAMAQTRSRSEKSGVHYQESIIENYYGLLVLCI